MGGAARLVSRFSHFAMSTTFELIIGGKERSYAEQTAQAVFEEIDRIERLFNFFDPGSELSLINRLGPGQSLRIGAEIYECLSQAEEIRAETNGAFDINVRSLIKYKSETDSEKRKTADFPLELKRSSLGFEVSYPYKVEIENSPGLSIDLGGIGKGYALDRAAEILDDWGVDQALVQGGTSSVLVRGSAPDRFDEFEVDPGWPVGVGGAWQLPDAPRKVMLKDESLSGSGKEVKGEHIIDPESGYPADGHEASWVSCPNAAAADALSTAFVVLDSEGVREYCEKHPEVWAFVISGDRNYKIFNQERIKILE